MNRIEESEAVFRNAALAGAGIALRLSESPGSEEARETGRRLLKQACGMMELLEQNLLPRGAGIPTEARMEWQRYAGDLEGALSPLLQRHWSWEARLSFAQEFARTALESAKVIGETAAGVELRKQLERRAADALRATGEAGPKGGPAYVDQAMEGLRDFVSMLKTKGDPNAWEELMPCTTCLLPNASTGEKCSYCASEERAGAALR